jgi:hypothetical protein
MNTQFHAKEQKRHNKACACTRIGYGQGKGVTRLLTHKKLKTNPKNTESLYNLKGKPVLMLSMQAPAGALKMNATYAYSQSLLS